MAKITIGKHNCIICNNDAEIKFRKNYYCVKCSWRTILIQKQKHDTRDFKP